MGKASRKKKNLFNDTPEKTSGHTEPSAAIIKTDIVRKPIVHVLIIIILGLIVYSNTFHVPFQFDDVPNITNDPIIKDLKYFVDPSNANESLYYPPLKIRFIGYLSFALNYKLNGLNVTGYHIFNLAVHIINALLVYWIVLLTFKTPALKPSPDHDQHFPELIALFSALLFVSHPVQTQAVTYVVQRLASLTAMFYLISVVGYIKSRLSTQNITRYAFYAISFISAVLAMKTKEIAFTLPVMIAMYEFMFFEGKPKKRILNLLPIVLTMSIIPLTYLSLHANVGTLIRDVSEATRVQTAMPRLDYLLTEFSVIATYIRLLIVPIGQNLDYDYPVYHSFFVPQVFLSFLLLASIIGFGIFILLRYSRSAPYTKVISFGIFWFFVSISVESSIIPIEDVIFEHRVYLPFAGAAISMMTGLFAARDTLGHYRPQIGKSIIPLCVLIIIILSGAAYARNSIWRDQITLWSDVIEKSPNKARDRYNLGCAYQAQNLPDKAIEQYQIALTLKPNHVEAHLNLGLEYEEKGLFDKAMEQYQIASSLKPDYVEAHNNLGNMYQAKGLFDKAMEQYQMALFFNPDYAEAHNNLGNIYQSKGLSDKAIEQYQRALTLKPDYVLAHHNLGLAYQSKGLYDKAMEQYKTALSLDPNLAEAHFSIGLIYLDNGALDMARGEFELVLNLKPNDDKAQRILNDINHRLHSP